MESLSQVISQRAYARWVQNGQSPHTHLQDWADAEDELTRLTAQAHQLLDGASPETGQLLRAILDNATAVIYVKDVRGRYLLINPRYCALFELTPEQIIGRTDHDIFPAEFADLLRANDLRVLGADAPLEFEEQVPSAGRLHTYISLKFPIRGPAGAAYAVCGISTDITERRLAQVRLLAEHAVTCALAESAALADAAPRVLRTIGEALGWDVGLLWEVSDPEGLLCCTAVWHGNGVAAPDFGQFSRQMAHVPGVGLHDHVWAEERPIWVRDLTAQADFPAAPAVLGAGLHGACGFPVRNGGAVLGVLTFYSRAAQDFDEDVLAMMASVGSQLSQFIERRQAERALHERENELKLARAIQQARQPRSAPVLPGFELAGVCHPARETGGDYLDFVPMPDGSCAIAVGDASGHGMAAALRIAEARAYLRALARDESDPGRVLARLNRHLCEESGDDHFVTLLLARLDPGTHTLVYSSAGHWPGYVLDAAGRLKARLPSTGLPLGVDAAADLPAAAQTLEAGDLVLLLSDGVVEAFSPEGDLFGVERTLDSVRSHQHEAPGAIVAALFADVHAFTHGKQTDDMTAVVIKAGRRSDEALPSVPA